MSAKGLLRARLRCLAIAAGVGFAGSQAESRPAELPDPARGYPLAYSARVGVWQQDRGTVAAPPPPKPSPVDSRKLPAVFSQAAPVSIADLRVMEEHIKALVARVSPAVVEVAVGDARGSGVVISTNGLVLTAGHVCGEANQYMRVRFPDGRTTHGKSLGVDLENDTGLMQITGQGPWPQAAMGDLNDTRIGDWVLALGHPGGFDSRRSLVVRLGRIIRLARDRVQSDCPISPGDSGGPLFDMHGRVIGIHSAISMSPAENFHVPVTCFYDSWNELVKTRAAPGPSGLPRAYVGAGVVDKAGACCISAIETHGPAFKAGLEVGDLVLTVDGRDIKAAAAFRRWVAEAKPGEVLDLEIQRGGKVFSRQLKVRASPVER